jgi:hypothetical protein
MTRVNQLFQKKQKELLNVKEGNAPVLVWPPALKLPVGRQTGRLHCPGMFEIGASLREARTRQGLDFPEMEERTKVRAKYLRLLEEMVADAPRTAFAVDLAAEAASTHPTLVFSHRVEHCAKMRADILVAVRHVHRVGVVLGDQAYAAESRETVEGLKSGTYRCGVGTYQSIGTGVDLPSVESGVAVTPVLANRQNFVQVRDRLCRVDRRPGATKRSATLYVLWDRNVFGDRPLRNAVAWCAGRVQVLDADEWVDGREYLRRGDDYSLIGGTT